MHKSLLFSLSLITLIGCTKQEPKQENSKSEPVSSAVEKFGVNLNEYSDDITKDYPLDEEWQLTLAKQYGRPFYKANNICGTKYSYLLDKATSASVSTAIDEFNLAQKKCIIESLKGITPEPNTYIAKDELTNTTSKDSESPKVTTFENSSSQNYIYDAGGWRYDDTKQKWVNARDDGRSDIAVTYRDGRVKPATTESSRTQTRSRDEAPSIRNKDTNENVPYGYDEEHYGADVGMEIKSTASPKDRKTAKCIIYFERLHRKGAISEEDGTAGTLRCLSNGGVI